jgi:hypothetical protein
LSKVSSTARDVIVAEVRIIAVSWLGGRHPWDPPQTAQNSLYGAEVEIVDVLSGKAEKGARYTAFFGARGTAAKYIYPRGDARRQQYFAAFYGDERSQLQLAGFPATQEEYEAWYRELLKDERERSRSGARDKLRPVTPEMTALRREAAAGQRTGATMAQAAISSEPQDRILFTFGKTALSIERSAISSVRDLPDQKLSTTRSWNLDEKRHHSVWFRLDVSHLLPDHVTCRIPMSIGLRPGDLDLKKAWLPLVLDGRATKPTGFPGLSEFVFDLNEPRRPPSYERFYQIDAPDLRHSGGEPLRFICTKHGCKTSFQILPGVVTGYAYYDDECGLGNFVPVTRAIFTFLKAREVRR